MLRPYGPVAVSLGCACFQLHHTESAQGRGERHRGPRAHRCRPIAAGELVAIKGGRIVTTTTVRALPERLQNSEIQIADGFHLAALDEAEYEPDRSRTHPTAWARDGPEQQRAGKPGERSAELTGGRRAAVDLQPGQKEQKAQAKQRYHIDRLIDLHPSQDGRPDDSPGDDLHDELGSFTRRTDAARMGAATALMISSPLKLTVLMGRTPSGATTQSATSCYRRMPVNRPAMGMTPGPGRRVPD